MVSKVMFLGYVVSGKGLRVNESTIEGLIQKLLQMYGASMDWQPSTDTLLPILVALWLQ